jgi:hypothetical protein
MNFPPPPGSYSLMSNNTTPNSPPPPPNVSPSSNYTDLTTHPKGKPYYPEDGNLTDTQK